MKFAVRLLLSLAAIAVGTVLVLPSLIDWNALKPQIEARLEKELGRDVTLGGSIKASLIPEPHLEVNDVAIANAPGGEAPSLLQLKSLEARIAVAPLLSGRIVVKGLRLVEPVLTLERMADGAFNFSFADAGAPGARHLALFERVEPAAADRAFRLDPQAVSLDKVEVVKGTLVYRDRMLDATERLTELDGVLSAKTLAGPYAGEAGFAWRGRRWGVTGDLARPGEDGQYPLIVKLTEPAINLKASLIGRLANLPADAGAPWRLSGALVLRAERPEILWQDAPAAPPRPLAMEGALRLDPAQGEIRDIALRWGDFTGSGAARLDLGKDPRYSFTGSGRALDLDALLGPPPPELPQIWPLAVLAPPAAAIPATDPASAAPRGLASALKGELDLKLGSLTFRKAEIASLAIEAKSDAEGLHISKASALLPGKSEFTLSGLVMRAGPGLHYNGALGLASERARELLAWAGFPVEGVAQDRLGRLAYRGGVDLSPGAIELLNFQAGLDGAQIQGFLGGTSNGPDGRPTVHGQIRATRFNLDPYRALFGQAQDRPVLEIASDVIDAIDGVLAFDFDSLAFGDEDAQGVWGKLELKSGRVGFDTLNVTDWRGARIEGSGEFMALGGRSTARWLGQATGADMRPVLSHLGMAAEQGDRPIGPWGLRIEIALQNGSGQVTADGAIAGAQVIFASELSSVEAPFEGRLGEGGRVASTLAFESDRAQELGSLLGWGMEVSSADAPALLSARYEVGPARHALTFSTTVGPDVARVSWRREGAGDAARLSLELDAKANDLGQTLAMLGAHPEMRSALAGPFGLHVSASGPRKAVALTRLDYSLGAEHISGGGTADLTSARAAVDLALETSHIDLTRYLNLVQAPLRRADGTWRDTPIPLAGLDAFDGHVALKSEALGVFGTVFEDIALDAKLEAGTLSLGNIKSGWGGGAMTANATLRGGGQLPGFALSMKFADIDSAQLGALLIGRSFSKGPLSGSVLLRSQGASPLALASALSGDIKLKGGEGLLEGFDLATFETRRKALQKGEAADPVLGALTGGASAMHGADIAFAIEQGLAQCTAGIVDFDKGRGVLTGRIDLPQRRLALDLNLPATGLAATPHLTIGGALEAPKTTLVVTGVGEALRAEAAARQLEPPPAAPEPLPAPPPAEGPDRLRSLIESLPSRTQ